MKRLETKIEQCFHRDAVQDPEQHSFSTLPVNCPEPVFLLANQTLKENQTILNTSKPLINKEATLLNQTIGRWQQLLVTKAALHDSHEQSTDLAALVRNTIPQRQAEDALRLVNRKLREEIAELEQQTQEMSLLIQMIDLLSACQNMEDAYKIIEDQMGILNLADSGALYMSQPSRNNLQRVAAWGQSVFDPLVFPLSDCWGLRRGQYHIVKSTPTAHKGDHHANPLICPHISPGMPGDWIIYACRWLPRGKR